jgi:hypothetical protein
VLSGASPQPESLRAWACGLFPSITGAFGYGKLHCKIPSLLACMRTRKRDSRKSAEVYFFSRLLAEIYVIFTQNEFSFLSKHPNHRLPKFGVNVLKI